MKKLYVLALAALTAGSAVAVTPSRQRVADMHRLVQTKGIRPASRHKAAAKGLKTVVAPAEATEWLPGSVEIEEYYEGNWELAGTTFYTYSPEGLMLTEEGDGSRITYTYDDNGNMTEKLTETTLNGITYQPSERVTYGYDTVLKNFMVSLTTHYYTNGAWNRNGQNARFDIQRNAAGAITSVKRYDWTSYMGDVCVSSLEITHGADGKASSMAYSEYSYDTGDLQPVQSVSNLQWITTDGQITNIDDYTSPTNRAKSATVTYAEGDEYNIQYAYPDNDSESYVGALTAKYVDSDVTYDIRGTETYTQLDQQSYELDITQDYYDGDTFLFNARQIQREILGMGDLTIETYYAEAYDGALEVYQWSRGAFEYDTADGHPVSHTLEDFTPAGYEEEETADASTLAEPEGTWTPVMRVKFYDVEKAGIQDITADNNDANAPVEYYNMQGIRVNNPTPGLYICRQGRTVTKQLVR